MNSRVQNALQLTPELLRATGEELGWLETSEPLILERITELADPSDASQAARRTSALLKGSLLIYLFALWQSHMPDDFKTWMTEAELLEFEAFEHVRDSVAHGSIGQRAKHPRKRKAFVAFYPFSGVEWDKERDRIDISASNVVNDFFSLMMGMSSQLAARFHAGN